jgi:two-component system chemotaxis sensor kinase CheA
MKTRMQPIGNIWAKFPRVVRDLAKMCGKEVRLDMEGKDTELDKTIIEAIKDPLTHIVRNSIDHGVETPERRAAAGKDREGRILMRAFHEGGQVNIEISDDGGGIDVERVRAKIVEKGLLPQEAAARLSERECIQHIFAPGFSTAAQVTNVSGRGVGMDVVKRNIERLRGQIQIETEQGRGTTFRIRLPLTTAIIDGLLVRVGEERFILPTITVQMALRPARAALATVQGRGEVMDHRGKILPLHRLHRIFGVEGAVEDPAAGIVVIVEVGRRLYALLVDELLNKQEVVIKNLGAFLQGRPGVAGGAILGDGTIALILDPASLCGS